MCKSAAHVHRLALPPAARAALISAARAEGVIGLRSVGLAWGLALAASLAIAALATLVQHAAGLPQGAVAWPGVAIAVAGVVLALERWHWGGRADPLVARARMLRAVARLVMAWRAAATDRALATQPDLHGARARGACAVFDPARIPATTTAAMAALAGAAAHRAVACAPRAQRAMRHTAGGSGGRDG